MFRTDREEKKKSWLRSKDFDPTDKYRDEEMLETQNRIKENSLALIREMEKLGWNPFLVYKLTEPGRPSRFKGISVEFLSDETEAWVAIHFYWNNKAVYEAEDVEGYSLGDTTARTSKPRGLAQEVTEAVGMSKTSSVKGQLIKLGYEKPELREHLTPVLSHLEKTAALAEVLVSKESAGCRAIFKWEVRGQLGVTPWMVYEDAKKFSKDMKNTVKSLHQAGHDVVYSDDIVMVGAREMKAEIKLMELTVEQTVKAISKHAKILNIKVV